MEPLLLLPALIVLIICAIVGGWFPSKKYVSMLLKWAEKNNYKIIKYKMKLPILSPFTFASNGQRVFLVTIELKEGKIKECWVCCGNWFFGNHSEEVKVKWI
ncbi:MAG TPA: hypothetical protein DET40_18730 [Lentisphaeria bacterium]|nr:MAG: hypothetical protein A2X45_25635 [Lentisphaerae bacterium GWF2_50_93]HCE45581.1 hypothetical protein [Lentisphaeria bacterium]